MTSHMGHILPIESLPQVCIFLPDKMSFYQYYDVDEKCPCGACEWHKDKIAVKFTESQFDLPYSEIYRCTECKAIRLARLKNKFARIFNASKKLEETLEKIYAKDSSLDNSELLDIIGNAYARLGCKLYGEKFIENLTEVSHK